MAKPKEVLLREFLAGINIPTAVSPPWVHSTESSKLISVIQQEKLLAVSCNVFKKDKLCYLFVGRPAYKSRDIPNPEAWQLPTAFVMRFEKPPAIKRVYPFDSGAFHRGRLPDYITTFKKEDFELPPDGEHIGRLISLYFDTSRRYVQRKPLDEEKLKSEHLLNMSHARILALGKLYREGSTPNVDDRASAIEVQVEEDIHLNKANLLGVVIPEEYAQTPGVRAGLSELTNVIET